MAIYSRQEDISLVFDPDNHEVQACAAEILHLNGLDREAQARLESRWNVQWLMAWRIGKANDMRLRYLFQWYLV